MYLCISGHFKIMYEIVYDTPNKNKSQEWMIVIIMWKRQNFFDPRPDWYRYLKIMEGRSRFIFRRLAVQQFNATIKIINDVIYFVKNRKTAKQEEEDQLWTDIIYSIQMIQNWNFKVRGEKQSIERSI